MNITTQSAFTSQLEACFLQEQQAYNALSRFVQNDPLIASESGLQARIALVNKSTVSLKNKAGKELLVTDEGKSGLKSLTENYRKAVFAFSSCYVKCIKSSSYFVGKIVQRKYQCYVEDAIQRITREYLNQRGSELKDALSRVVLKKIDKQVVSPEDVFYLDFLFENTLLIGFLSPIEKKIIPVFKEIDLTDLLSYDHMVSVDETARKEIEGVETVQDAVREREGNANSEKKSGDLAEINVAGEGGGSDCLETPFEEDEYDFIDFSLSNLHEEDNLFFRPLGEAEVFEEYKENQIFFRERFCKLPAPLYFESEQEATLYSLGVSIQRQNQNIVSQLGEAVRAYQLRPGKKICILKRVGDKSVVQEVEMSDECLQKEIRAHRNRIEAYCAAYRRFGGERFQTHLTFIPSGSSIGKAFSDQQLRYLESQIIAIAKKSLANREIKKELFHSFSISEQGLKVIYKKEDEAVCRFIQKELSEEENDIWTFYKVYEEIAATARDF